MTVMVAEIYDALREAGASEEKAPKAAEVLAGSEGRFSAIETRLAVLMVMVASLYALLLPGTWLLLRVAQEAGALG
jgi:hypothetical protein